MQPLPSRILPVASSCDPVYGVSMPTATTARNPRIDWEQEACDVVDDLAAAIHAAHPTWNYDRVIEEAEAAFERGTR